jgi:guanylate kinase
MPNALTVFLMPPTEEELERRLRGRGTENENEIAKRLAAAKDELKTASEYSYIIVNENAKHAAQEILNIIKEHRAI